MSTIFIIRNIPLINYFVGKYFAELVSTVQYFYLYLVGKEKKKVWSKTKMNS